MPPDLTGSDELPRLRVTVTEGWGAALTPWLAGQLVTLAEHLAAVAAAPLPDELDDDPEGEPGTRDPGGRW